MSTTPNITALPWKLDPPTRPIDGRHGWFIRPCVGSPAPAIAEIPRKCWPYETTNANANYIVTACNNFPEILEAIHQAERELRQLGSPKSALTTLQNILAKVDTQRKGGQS